MKKNVIQLIDQLSKVYRDKPIAEIDSIATDLFWDTPSTTIVGTSGGEWCLGFDSSKKLLLNDLKHWGPVLLNTDQTSVCASSSVAWFTTPGTVAFDFQKNPDSMNRFLTDMRSYIEEERSWMGNVPDAVKMTTMAYELGHFLSGEGQTERWKFMLSGIATCVNNTWKFAHLMFSFPLTSLHPDERIVPGNCYEAIHQKTTQQVQSYMNEYSSFIDSHQSFIVQQFLCSTLSGEKIDCSEPVIFNEDTQWMNVDHVTTTGTQNVEKELREFTSQWGMLYCSNEQIMVFGEKPLFWFIASGIVRKTMSKEIAIQKELEWNQRILDSCLSPQEKLHRMFLNVLSRINAVTQGDNYEWPIRIQGVIERKEHDVVCRFLSFSFPTNVILEGKTEEILFEA